MWNLVCWLVELVLNRPTIRLPNVHSQGDGIVCRPFGPICKLYRFQGGRQQGADE